MLDNEDGDRLQCKYCNTWQMKAAFSAKGMRLQSCKKCTAEFNRAPALRKIAQEKVRRGA